MKNRRFLKIYSFKGLIIKPDAPQQLKTQGFFVQETLEGDHFRKPISLSLSFKFHIKEKSRFHILNNAMKFRVRPQLVMIDGLFS